MTLYIEFEMQRYLKLVMVQVYTLEAVIQLSKCGLQ
jgi:hypothetical protein